MTELVVDTKKIEARTGNAVVQAESLTVATDQHLEEGAGFLTGLKTIRKEIANTFDPIARKLHEAHKEVVAQKKRHSEPVEKAERIVKKKIGAYLGERERLRREAEEKLLEQVRKDEENRKQEEALALEKEGKNKEAEALIEQPVEVPAVVIPKTETKVEGISKLRKVWKFRVVDASRVPDRFKKVDEVKLGQVVRANKGELEIPGVEIYSEDTVSAR